MREDDRAERRAEGVMRGNEYERAEAAERADTLADMKRERDEAQAALREVEQMLTQVVESGEPSAYDAEDVLEVVRRAVSP